ncbi:MAG: response regulator [Carboxylicivirga sp.]|nr:response regulator [Carboxylicivirga sp.]
MIDWIWNSKIGMLILQILIAILTCTSSFSQESKLNFQTISISDGLSHNNINCIFQDSRGFLWIGTKDGLNRYDGYNILTYFSRREDEKSLSNNYIQDICEDPHGKGIWIGTRKGLNFFDFRTESFERLIFNNDSIAGFNRLESVTAIESDYRGNLWLGTNLGLIKLLLDSENKNRDYSKLKIKILGDISKSNDNLLRERISCLFMSRQGDLWIGYDNSKLYQLSIASEKIHRTDLPELIEGRVKGITEDNYGNLWIITSNEGLIRLNYNDRKIAAFTKENHDLLQTNLLNAICNGEKGEIWIGTKNHGLVQGKIIEKPDNGIELKFNHYINKPNDLNSIIENTVRCVYKDKSGVIWVGTRGNGVVKVSSHPEHFKKFPRNHNWKKRLILSEINSVLEDQEGIIWIGSKNGVCSYSRETSRYSYYSPSRKGNMQSAEYRDVFTICEDDKGNLWMGTNGGGLDHFNSSKRKFRHFNIINCELSSDNISSIISLSSGDILLGTMGGGVDIIKNSELEKNVPHISPLQINIGKRNAKFYNSRKIIFEDRNKDIWVTTTLDGLYVYNTETRKTIHYFNDPNNSKSLPSDHITAIYEDQKGELWLGCTKGLIRFNKKSGEGKLYSIKDGLPDLSVIDIVSDDNENLWVLSRNWISRFNPRTEKIRNFKIQHRVTDEFFTHNPLWKSKEGEIIVGTQTEGVISFFPDSIKDATFLPPVAIIDFRISGESVTFEPNEKSSILTQSINSIKEIELKYHQNDITFEFVSLSYLFPEENQHACILEGAQEEWQYMGDKRRFVNYFDLSPGEYVFRVKASNSDGLWNEKGKSINIKILPPWWRTWWAYSSYAIIIIVICFALLSYAYQWIKLKNKLAVEQMERVKIEELNRAKLKFFTNITHEFRTPLTLILGPLERLLRSNVGNQTQMRQYTLMHQNASRLLRLINQLMDFRKAENKQMKLRVVQIDIVNFVTEIMHSFEELAQEKQICFELKLKNDIPRLWIDKDKMDKVLFNILSNAFKFTPNGGDITIELNASDATQLKVNEKRLEIRVIDNGIGMTEEQKNKIFERFYQVEQDKNGTGIGLSLSRSLIELHKGDITVASKNGEGSCFTITIPIGDEHLKPEEMLQEQDDAMFNTQGKTSKSYREAGMQNVNIENENSFAKSAKTSDYPLLLIVDDNENLLSFICESLEDDYRILTADNGKNALKVAEKTPPDLIVSDVMMPEMDGFELCRAIKNNTIISHIPIILLTALDSEKDHLMGYKIGADDYISKPFSPELLSVRIKNLIEIRRDLKSRFRKDISLEPCDITIASADEKLLEKALNVIENNISDPDLTVEKLGQEIGISRVHLYRKIKNLTDQTATEFIRTIRMKRAAKLLLQEKLTVSEISFLVGFKNPVSFGRSFKVHFGETPTQYIANYSKS